MILYNIFGVIYVNVLEINVLVLAYLGDTIYENYVRRYLIQQGISNVNDLQKEAISYVSAKSQASLLHKMIDEKFLTDEELDVVHRARNYKTTSHPKSCDIVTYKTATGLEALIGFLDLEGKNERIQEIMNFILR
ncbi:MAG: Mini-ribonuclease 3 [Bacilli bacterium]|nr:Mini-ribonuclease 3 [Bacilli bacterium]